MKLTVRHIPQQFVAQSWPLVEEFIAAAEKFNGGDHSIDHIKTYLSLGHWILVAAVDEDGVAHGAATLSFSQYPNDRVAFITYMGGNMITNVEVLDQLKTVVSGMGATKIQGAVRPSMARLCQKCGFEERYVVVEVKI